MVDDFYQFYPEVYYTEGKRNRTGDYRTEGHSVITVPAEKSGVYTVYYYAYPEEITSMTSDEYELTSPRDVVAILPLYMASQLYAKHIKHMLEKSGMTYPDIHDKMEKVHEMLHK